MAEPFFIAQTFDPHVVGDEAEARAWFDLRAKEAAAEGGTFPRFTMSEAGDGLLFECWKERPVDQGAPRWQMQQSN